jgi:aspartate carbamoyltransferase catalytic subunit
MCDDLRGCVVVNAFFENSTRTRTSFEIAAKRLGAHVINFNSVSSSVAKGETLFDTLQTLDAMSPDIIVMRHHSSGAAEFATHHVKSAVLNAGDGAHEHPTQALLDAMTLLDVFDSLAGKRIGIVGDVLHSRVFRSDSYLLNTLGAKIIIAAPPTLMPHDISAFKAELCGNAAELIRSCDAVMTLRLQTERMQGGLIPSLAEYASKYGLLNKHFTGYEHVYVMHPGPVNYGVEIEFEIANSPQSLIRRQVENGVFIRMACLKLLSEKKSV